MQFLSLNERACALRSEAFNACLHCLGLTAGELGGLFASAAGRPDWARLIPGRLTRNRPTEDQALRIGLAGEIDPDCRSDEPLQWQRMEHGAVALTSGRPGRARIEPCAELAERLLPQPLHLLLAQQWARQGLFPLHAAALEWQGHGVLILGPQAAGKSSLVLAAVAHGARVVSDDWVLVGRDPEGRWRAERLRQFLMLRTGPLLESCRSALPSHLTTTRDGRQIWPIEAGQDQFPAEMALDRCLWLEAPGKDRPSRSATHRMDQAQLLARLIEAAMPILLTRSYPIEADTLMRAFTTLSARLPHRSGVSGRDLLDSPRRVLDRLLGPS